MDADSGTYPGVTGLTVVERPGDGRSQLTRSVCGPGLRESTPALQSALAGIAPTLVHAHFGWNAARRPTGSSTTGTTTRRYVSRERCFRPSRVCARSRRLSSCVQRGGTDSRSIGVCWASCLRRLGCSRPIHVIPPKCNSLPFPFEGRGRASTDLGSSSSGAVQPVKVSTSCCGALPIVRETYPAATLDVVGDGTHADEYRSMSSQLDLQDVVTFHGTTRGAGVLTFLQRADLFVLPNVTRPDGQAEGLGNIGKEAQAVGVPIVATDSGGIPETIPPEHRSALVPNGKPRGPRVGDCSFRHGSRVLAAASASRSALD